MRYHDIAKVARINSSGLSFGGTLYDDTLTLRLIRATFSLALQSRRPELYSGGLRPITVLTETLVTGSRSVTTSV